ncbi:hypothetical protein ACLB2K_037539 [Fragaria x ananassa]
MTSKLSVKHLNQPSHSSPTRVNSSAAADTGWWPPWPNLGLATELPLFPNKQFDDSFDPLERNPKKTLNRTISHLAKTSNDPTSFRPKWNRLITDNIQRWYLCSVLLKRWLFGCACDERLAAITPNPEDLSARGGFGHGVAGRLYLLQAHSKIMGVSSHCGYLDYPINVKYEHSDCQCYTSPPNRSVNWVCTVDQVCSISTLYSYDKRLCCTLICPEEVLTIPLSEVIIVTNTTVATNTRFGEKVYKYFRYSLDSSINSLSKERTIVFDNNIVAGEAKTGSGIPDSYLGTVEEVFGMVSKHSPFLCC